MKLEQLGPYRLIRKLGRGGMGTVYEGVNVETNEPAAVKVLSSTLSDEPDFRQRFEVEIETLRKLKHPNIVRLFGFGQQEDLLFYAMELVDGISLEEEIRRDRFFDWRELAKIGIETCRALRHAHDRGIIHRDIKPANLLLASDQQTKLTDFGIARLFGNTGLTSIGGVLGTVEFMAGEQCDGRQVDPRTDLYSLGAVLYALAAGRAPFQGRSNAEILRKQRFDPPKPLSGYTSEVPVELAAIIAQLMEKKPQNRFPNATVVARRLEAIVERLSAKFEESETAVDDAGSEGDQADSQPAAPDASADRRAAAALPPTHLSEDEPRRPPSAGGSRELANELPETKGTSAFGPFEASEQPDSVSADEPEAPIIPDGQFTVVPHEELDQVEPEPSGRHPMGSLQTWLLAAGLLGVGLIVRYFLQPPSGDALYQRIISQTGDGTTESLVLAEADIRQFQDRFPKDPRSLPLRSMLREIDLHRLERKFQRLQRTKAVAAVDRLLPIELAYLEAIQYLQLDPVRGMAKLQALIDLYGGQADDSGPTGQCVELAQRRLDRLREQLGRHTPRHLALVQNQLDEAEQLSHDDPARARKMWQAAIELYEDKPWAAEAVQRARAALAKHQEASDTREHDQ